ncbi:MAG: class I SAM-dependent rRNA methyltransferase [Gammaproteobacteria bacterium]
MNDLSPSHQLPPLRLKKNEDRRLRAGHLWVFSNEVDAARTPLTGFEPGQPVELQASNGRSLGSAYVNPHSLICARLVSRDAAHPLGESLLVHRLQVALSLRERVYAQPCYRLVYGESDGLPGLVVDRFDSVLVVQITTAGMERVREQIVAALVKVLRPSAVLLRNDSPVRELEGLTGYVEPVLGEVPAQVDLEENGVRFRAALAAGQKTGWYYDHRDNRARLARYVSGRRVLDVFSYIGAWGVQAAVAGAAEVVCVDGSRTALDQLAANARLNGVAGRVHGERADAFDVLKSLREARERFDVVVLDPPAFIKRRKDVKEGVEAYRRLNQLAMRVLSRDGILVSASCSFHLQRAELQRLVLQSARHLDRNVLLLEQGGQGPDHPVHPAIPETDYLKALITRVLPA